MHHSELIINWKKVFLTHWGRVTHICVSNLAIIGSNKVGTKPLSEPMPEYCQLDPWESTSVKFLSNFKHFYSLKWFESVVCEMAAILSRPQCVLNTVIRVSAKPSKCISRYTTKAYENNLWCTKRATYLLRCGPFGKDWNSQRFYHVDIIGKLYLWFIYSIMADSKFAPSQWETVLLCNDVSHWLGANLESGLQHCIYIVLTSIVIVISHTVIVLMWTNTLTSALLTSII